MYLEKRRRRWYAVHEIPEDVREAIGKGKQFFKSLETEDKTAAKRRAAILEVQWLDEIETARKGTSDHTEQDAAFWRKILRDSPDEQKEVVLSLIADETDSRIVRALERAGFTDYKEEGAMDLPEVEDAYRFQAIATGRMVKLDEHLDEWITTLTNETKTKDMKKSTILRFAEEFPYVSDVKGKDVQRWINRMASDEGKKANTIQRSLSEIRGYWSYLISIEVVAEDRRPFEKLTTPQDGNKRTAGVESWLPFTPEDVVSLLRAAEAKEDTVLADLIRLGMWTGARIESLCALRVDEVRKDSFDILHDKSQAGRRTVPIHSKLKPTMDRLIKAAGTDGYVLPGLTLNKYGDRSDAIGKRFGRLKAGKKFGPQHVFHSIRKTVATLLENAGVSATTMAYAMIATTVASTAASMYAQNQQASAQASYEQAQSDANAKQMQQNADLANQAYVDQTKQLQIKNLQDSQSAQQQIIQNDQAAMKAEGTVKASAADAGVSGLSVDALMADYQRQQLNYNQTVNVNQRWVTQQMGEDMKTSQATANGRIASIQPYIGPPIKLPDYLGTFANGASSIYNTGTNADLWKKTT